MVNQMATIKGEGKTWENLGKILGRGRAQTLENLRKTLAGGSTGPRLGKARAEIGYFERKPVLSQTQGNTWKLDKELRLRPPWSTSVSFLLLGTSFCLFSPKL